MLYYDRTHSSLLILPPFHRSPCSAPFFATTCCNYSSCASSSCFSSSCATCQAYSTMSWTGRELTMRHDIGNEIKDEEGHDNRGIGDEKCEERQSQRPIAGVAEQTPLPQPSSRVGSSPLSQLSLPAVPTTLRTAGKEARSMLSSSGSPPSAALPPSPLFSIVPITDSSSESNPQLHKDASSVLVPQPTGFRCMHWEPVTGRRICFYFNQTGCTAGARCAYAHVKRDISNIIPGTFHKPAVASTASSSSPPSLPPSCPLSSSSYLSWEREVSNRPHHHHPPSFPVGDTLSSFPAPFPTYVPPGPPLSLPATPAYVMYYVGVPSSYSRSLPFSYSPGLSHFCRGSAPPPVPTVLLKDKEEGMQGRWGDAQWYHHQMQPGQQAAGAMDEEWAGGMMDVRGVDMQHAYYEQHYHYYSSQQMATTR